MVNQTENNVKHEMEADRAHSILEFNCESSKNGWRACQAIVDIYSGKVIDVGRG